MQELVSRSSDASVAGPGIALHRLEVEGPLFEEWPLRGHKLRFGDVPAEDIGPKNQRDKPWYRPNYRLVSSDPAGDLARVLPPFLEAAFRRPVTAEIAAPFVASGQAELAAGSSLEQALRTAQLAALCTPDFLFLLDPEGRLDDYGVAARLSYILWGLPTDAELLSLAAKGELTVGQASSLPSSQAGSLRHETLRTQTERLLVKRLQSRSVHWQKQASI